MKLSEHKKNNITWVDVINPSKKDLEQIAEKFNLHSASVQDCMDPEHLPKFEKIGTTSFIILRAYDLASNKKINTVQGLTRKLAIFFTDQFILTFHRKEQPYVQACIDEWLALPEGSSTETLPIVADLVLRVTQTYEVALAEANTSFEKYEEQVFDQDKFIKLQHLYLLKRRSAIIKKMLRTMLEPTAKLIGQTPENTRYMLQNSKESAEKMLFQADELYDNLTTLLSLQISLASHRTNEVMRVLTIFSVFFLPLNFIAGIYGMNFQHMPELQWTAGYPAALVTMCIVALSIYIWFRKKQWL